MCLHSTGLRHDDRPMKDISQIMWLSVCTLEGDRASMTARCVWLGKGVECTVEADGAAFSIGNLWIGTVWCILADHLIAHDGPAVTDADLAGLRFPYILVVVILTIQCAATEWDCKDNSYELAQSITLPCHRLNAGNDLRGRQVQGVQNHFSILF